MQLLAGVSQADLQGVCHFGNPAAQHPAPFLTAWGRVGGSKHRGQGVYGWAKSRFSLRTEGPSVKVAQGPCTLLASTCTLGLRGPGV